MAGTVGATVGVAAGPQGWGAGQTSGVARCTCAWKSPKLLVAVRPGYHAGCCRMPSFIAQRTALTQCAGSPSIHSEALAAAAVVLSLVVVVVVVDKVVVVVVVPV